MKTNFALLAALLALACPPAALAAGECGTIRLYDVNNTRQKVYPVYLIEVDGKTEWKNKYLKQMPVGPHKLKIGERIPNAELSQQVARWNDRSIRTRELDIDVQPNVLYVIGAKFNSDKRTDVKAYWAPIVLRDEGHPCSLD
jgi:hypothetical protein